MTQQLSPAARSVFESFNSKFDWIEDGVPGPQFKAIAAAIRAAADQGEILFDEYDDPIQAITVENLLAIAKELEAN